MYQHHRLNSSRLVLLLQQWAQAHSGPVRLDVAEQLSQWLSTVDAVKLSRALHALEASQIPSASVGLGAGAVDVRALQASLQTARADLTDLVTAKAAPTKPMRERADNTPVDAPDPEAGADFAAHAARYLALQKQMDTRLATLRAQVRQTLSVGPEGLRRLAMLDAVMEQMLGVREQRLWASLPGHLERRMTHLRAAHQQQLAAAGRDDEPQRWALPGGWLFAFEQDLRALLLAELQVRLEPLAGLLEAAQSHEHHPSTPHRPPKTNMSPEQVTGMIE
ncbi:hypothetical protein ASE52_02570 [Acidovorax sp. Root275]|nr:hypothetical protein ASE52_02570 [Acidovorax sp. Root275]